MMISSKGRYALRVMLDMAERYPETGGGENDKSLHGENPVADENNKAQSGESRKDGAAGTPHGGKPGEVTPGGDGYMRLNEIAARQGISKKYLESIMTVLTKSGLVESAVGKTGGYRLCRAPDGYTVGEILRAAEGSLAPVSCLEDGAEHKCADACVCYTLPFWYGLEKRINEYIDSYTLADILREKGNAGCAGCNQQPVSE